MERSILLFEGHNLTFQNVLSVSVGLLSSFHLPLPANMFSSNPLPQTLLMLYVCQEWLSPFFHSSEFYSFKDSIQALHNHKNSTDQCKELNFCLLFGFLVSMCYYIISFSRQQTQDIQVCDIIFASTMANSPAQGTQQVILTTYYLFSHNSFFSKFLYGSRLFLHSNIYSILYLSLPLIANGTIYLNPVFARANRKDFFSSPPVSVPVCELQLPHILANI